MMSIELELAITPIGWCDCNHTSMLAITLVNWCDCNRTGVIAITPNSRLHCNIYIKSF